MSNVLVISPHPDDESIGCGGAICKHVDEGDIVQVIFLTSGEKGGHGKSEEETSKQREMEAQHAAEILKLSGIEFWKQPDGKFEASFDNVARLVNKIEAFRPTIIYVPHGEEQHPDHRAAALLVRLAVNKLAADFRKPLILMYEVWTPIQKMDYIIDISPYIETKRKSILAHKCQCDVLRFDEAILGLNRYRGEMHSWPGGNYAEVFQTSEF
jgi:LmbE family N-acetylglucosaminyl deacetylase